MPATNTVTVHPKPGVRLFVGGKIKAFREGHAVELPAAHAQALLDSGHVETPEQKAAREADARP